VEISRRAAAISRACSLRLAERKDAVMGEVSEAELFEAFTEQAKAWRKRCRRSDFETMSDLAEAQVGIRAAHSTRLPVIVSWHSIPARILTTP